MTESVILLICAVLIGLAGLLVARWISLRVGWPAAGPLSLVVAAPLIPSSSIAFGLSLDDILPLVGVLLLVQLVPWRSITSIRWNPAPGVQVAAIGVALMIVAGGISAVLNATDALEAIRLGLRGSGRMLFLVLIVGSLAILTITPAQHRFAALSMAMIGTFEAAFGLTAYFVGLPFGAGLEAPLGSSVLFGQVPGRISGTIGNSPNFTGALFVITIMVTAGLALQAESRRTRILLWSAAICQLAALTLTFTRVSLGLAVIGLILLVLMRSRPILLIPVGTVVVALSIATPLVTRLFNDAQNRIALWTSALLLMLDHPLGGVGAGEMLKAVALNPERYRNTPLGSAWSTAHNTILLAGAETGVIGAIGALLLNAGLVLIALRWLLAARGGQADSLQVGAALALGAFVAQGMVNNLFTVGVTGVFAAFLLGTQLLDARLEAPDTPRVSGRSGLDEATIALD